MFANTSINNEVKFPATFSTFLQLLDLGCGTHYQSSCAIQTSATDGSDDS